MWRYGQPESESLESVVRKNFRRKSVLCDGSWAAVEESRAEERRDLMSGEGGVGVYFFNVRHRRIESDDCGEVKKKGKSGLIGGINHCVRGS